MNVFGRMPEVRLREHDSIIMCQSNDTICIMFPI